MLIRENLLDIVGFLILISIYPTTMADYDTLADYFHELKGDITKVTWAHGVNSQELLQEALNGSSLMLEADIVLGYTSEIDATDPSKAQPVMAHPPTIVSNLTLKEFLDTFQNSGARKGIKLDFKSRAAFAASEALIEKLYYEKYRDFPVWLNADIVPGPVNATTKIVDPEYFLSSCISKFPYATISVGWSTYLESGSLAGEYSKEDVDRMTDVLSDNMVTIPVTFAVRAAFAARSVDRMIALIDTSPIGSTLTVWSSNSADVVDIEGLQKLINAIGTDRVYLDVSNEMINHLNSTGKSSAVSSISKLPSLASIAATLLTTFFFL